MEFDRGTVLLLCRRDDASEMSDAGRAALQDAHMAHLSNLHGHGRLLAAGPVRGSTSSNVAGICVFRDSVEEARALLEEDPTVKAGVFSVEVVSGSVPSGAVRFARARFPRSMADVERE